MSHIGGASVLPDLPGQIPPDYQIACFTANGVHALLAPPRRIAKPGKTVTAGSITRNQVLRALKFLGRDLWGRSSGCYRRSRAEPKMHCLKLLRHRLMAHDFGRKVADLQVPVTVQNRDTTFGTSRKKAVR